MNFSPETLQTVAELGGTVFVVVVAFWIWHRMSEKKDKLIETLLKDAKEDREANRKANTLNADKISDAHEKGMSQVAIAISQLPHSPNRVLHSDLHLHKTDVVLGKESKE